MKHLGKRLTALSLAGVMALGLAGCGGTSADSTATDGGTTATTTTGEAGTVSTPVTGNSGEVTTITLYPRDANLTSGLVTGYVGDYFADQGLAVDVWSYSDEKTNAILASGDLPDIMYVPVKNLDTMIAAGMLLNLDDYLDQMPHVQEFEELQTALNYVREYRSAGTGSLYCMPLNVGSNVTKFNLFDSTERDALKLRWDVYEEIGAPEMNSMDDVLDVMQQMVEAHPTEEDGTTCYGTVLNSGSDNNRWECITMWYMMQGYRADELAYLLESDMETGTVNSILSTDSMYYKGLKWYNEAYKRGLLDPDSINNDRSTQKAKIDSKSVMIPSGSLPGWSPNYLEYYIPGTKVHYNSNSPYGDSKHVLAINAKTANLEACLKFIDVMANPDTGLYTSMGPEGDFWYVDDQNNAFLSDKAKEYAKNNHDFTGYQLESGEKLALWNTPFVFNSGVETSFGDGKGGKRVNRSSGWFEYAEIQSDNELFKSWQETTGYSNWQELLADKDAFIASSDLDNLTPFETLPDDTMQLTIDAIKDKVVTASWKMVYAEDDAAFDALWNQMVADCEGLGAEDIIAWRQADIESAKKLRNAIMAE